MLTLSKCVTPLLCCLRPSRAAASASAAGPPSPPRGNPAKYDGAGRRRVHTPPQVHAVLAAPKERVILIGDVHGCLDELNDLLDACAFDAATDTVILVGDLVNKGPKSVGVVAAARERGFYAVRGNHDDSCLFAREKRDADRTRGDTPAADDKYSYTDSFSAEDLLYLRNLPYTLSLPSHKAIVVHAGLVPGVPLDKQDLAGMYTQRNLVPCGTSCGDDLAGMYTWSDGTKKGVPWAGEWPSDQPHVFFGHDAKRGLQQHTHATGLDTGCCYGKKLSAMILPERRLVQVPAREVYAQPGG